ncbi:MAG: 50S ribosomal protein L6 [Myxococcales bacterium]|nr:50S ribosomal protein L6 [Myxococcales bacterium]
MSRIGKLPVSVPANVSVKIEDQCISIKGPRGELKQPFRSEVSIAVEGDNIVITRNGDERTARAFHGLYRALIANMVTGVTQGFTKGLELVGVGYRAAVEKVDGQSCLVFKKGELGFSHPINFPIPVGVEAEVQDRTKIILRGNDKGQVGQIAATLRELRPPDAYKGKGIRYTGEQVRTKVGKTGGKGGKGGKK